MAKDPENPYDDKPLMEILAIVQDYETKHGAGTITFWLKFTCQFCGVRQTSADADTYHAGGYYCEECGQLSHPTRYGLLVAIAKERK